MAKSSKRDDTDHDVKTPDEIASDVSNVMMSMQVTFAPIVDGLVGYKAKLVSQGFSNEASDAMVVDYHRIILAILMNSI